MRAMFHTNEQNGCRKLYSLVLCESFTAILLQYNLYRTISKEKRYMARKICLLTPLAV
jgi:hypothetical protein